MVNWLHGIINVHKKYIILAPHPDDELIGCWRLLEAGLVAEVWYFFDIDHTRMVELVKLSEYYKFGLNFINIEKPNIYRPYKDTIILIPNINDIHPQHKQVNIWAKKYFEKYKKQYYSVDMNTTFDILPSFDSLSKQKLLLQFYPSQAKLFENEKYFLFESLRDDDSNKMIWVTFRKEGIHSYKEALSNPELSDVSFLGWPHRHIFHFKVHIEVSHDNREIEFIQFKRWLENSYSQGTLVLNNKSCEMIADDLAQFIRTKYPGRKMIIEVSEDGENGCTVEYLS